MKKKITGLLTVLILLLQTTMIAFAADDGAIMTENGNIIVDGICYSSDRKTILSCTELFVGDRFVVPDGVTAIGDNAFCGSMIKEISIADSVETIGKDAFYKSSVESVSFGKNSKLSEIGENAFGNCVMLHVISLPENIGEIAANAFAGCTGMQMINFWQVGEHDSLSLSPGDMNRDDRITASDARSALRIAAGLEKATPYSVLLGDIDRNGTITAEDARAILRTSAGLQY